MAWLLQALSGLIRLLPLRAALGLGAGLGWIWYHLIPVRRRVARDNLRRALPELTPAARRRIARRCFSQLARSAIELLRLPGLDRRRVEALIEHEGLEHLERARAAGRGVIAVTAHFGSFDLLACAEALRGLPIHAVSRSQHQPGVNRYWMQVRRRTGLGLLPAARSVWRIGRLLKKGEIVALVIDQHMPPGRGIPVPFFGRPASTTTAPAALALASGAPLLPVSIERLPAGRHRVRIEPPVPVHPGEDRPAEIERITRALNAWLEQRIRQRPDHWLWIHRRWKLDAPSSDGVEARP